MKVVRFPSQLRRHFSPSELSGIMSGIRWEPSPKKTTAKKKRRRKKIREKSDLTQIKRTPIILGN